jgi:hypothetical protein
VQVEVCSCLPEVDQPPLLQDLRRSGICQEQGPERQGDGRDQRALPGWVDIAGVTVTLFDGKSL